MGVALAYFLAKAGEQVTILEQTSQLGGLSGEFRFGDDLTVARYHHTILPRDQAVNQLCKDLGLANEIVHQSANAGLVYENQIFPMTNLRDFLTFPMLKFSDRLRLGKLMLQARLQFNWRELDSISVKEWLIQYSGRDCFNRIWQPFLTTKFDGVYDNISATYIWSWLNRMVAVDVLPRFQGRISYLQHGHYSLIQAMAEAFTQCGGRIEYEARVREIEIGDGRLRRIRTNNGVMQFDALVAAIPTPSFMLLIPSAVNDYLSRLEKAKYLGLICPVMILDKPLSSYWRLILTDPSCPFATIIETPYYRNHNHHLVYLPRYIAPDNDWMGVTDEIIREAWLSHLKLIFPKFNETSILHFAVSRARYVEPVFSVNMLADGPGVKTPYQGLYLANTGQFYPRLPTSDAAIVHARHVAAIVRGDGYGRSGN
jgi:protoporphyrinogen oxidase